MFSLNFSFTVEGYVHTIQNSSLVLFLRHFKYFITFSSHLHVFWEVMWFLSLFLYRYILFFVFPCAFFRTFFPLIFCSPQGFLFVCLLLLFCACPTCYSLSWICGLMPDVNLGEILTIIVPNIPSVPFVSVWYSNYVYVTLFVVAQWVLDSQLFFVFIFFSFYFLHFLVLEVIIDVSSRSDSFLNSVQSKRQSLLLLQHFWYVAFLFRAFLEFLSLLHCLSVLTCCLPCPLELLAYINHSYFAVRVWSYKTSVSAISDSDTYTVFSNCFFAF